MAARGLQFGCLTVSYLSAGPAEPWEWSSPDNMKNKRKPSTPVIADPNAAERFLDRYQA